VIRRSSIVFALTAVACAVLVNAPQALALATAKGGQGWWGESTDPQVANVMFATIAFFPVLIIVFSLLQWWLDKRHHAREDAERARASSPEWRGGW
jgi:fatty acid desaturase